MLLSQEIDLRLVINRWSDQGEFSADPWLEKKIELPFSFETMRTRGFIPTANVDINGDGRLDLLSSGAGEALEIYLGDPDRPFAKRAGKQKLNTNGVIHFRDFNGDGLEDFVIFDPHHFDVPLKVGVNLGRLPGTPPALRSPPTP